MTPPVLVELTSALGEGKQLAFRFNVPFDMPGPELETQITKFRGIAEKQRAIIELPAAEENVRRLKVALDSKYADMKDYDENVVAPKAAKLQTLKNMSDDIRKFEQALAEVEVGVMTLRAQLG